MQNQYYLDFYRKALVPVHPQGSSILKDKISDLSPPSFWLIAIEGRPGYEEKERYTWKVTVFPSDGNGVFDADAACFSSKDYANMDDAVEISRKLEKEIRESTPIPSLKNKIS